jgi:hypothetical protein
MKQYKLLVKCLIGDDLVENLGPVEEKAYVMSTCQESALEAAVYVVTYIKKLYPNYTKTLSINVLSITDIIT